MMNLYFEYIRSKNLVDEFESKFSYESIESLHNFLSNNLNKLEKQIFVQHYINGRSLKIIANSTNFSYSHIQGTNMRLKSKLSIALNFLVTNDKNNNNVNIENISYNIKEVNLSYLDSTNIEK